MNKKRREQLKMAIKLLDHSSDIVNSVSDEEQNAMDNMPENLQESDRYSDMEDAVDALQDALDSIDEAVSSIQEAIGE